MFGMKLPSRRTYPATADLGRGNQATTGRSPFYAASNAERISSNRGGEFGSTLICSDSMLSSTSQAEEARDRIVAEETTCLWASRLPAQPPPPLSADSAYKNKTSFSHNDLKECSAAHQKAAVAGHHSNHSQNTQLHAHPCTTSSPLQRSPPTSRLPPSAAVAAAERRVAAASAAAADLAQAHCNVVDTRRCLNNGLEPRGLQPPPPCGPPPPAPSGAPPSQQQQDNLWPSLTHGQARPMLPPGGALTPAAEHVMSGSLVGGSVFRQAASLDHTAGPWPRHFHAASAGPTFTLSPSLSLYGAAAAAASNSYMFPYNALSGYTHPTVYSSAIRELAARTQDNTPHLPLTSLERPLPFGANMGLSPHSLQRPHMVPPSAGPGGGGGQKSPKPEARTVRSPICYKRSPTVPVPTSQFNAWHALPYLAHGSTDSKRPLESHQPHAFSAVGNTATAGAPSDSRRGKNHSNAAPGAKPTLPPPPSPASSSQGLHFPPHFTKGSIIQLGNGELKRVEDLITEDFQLSADISPNLKVDSSSVTKIDMDTSETGVAMLGFLVGQRRKIQVTVEASVEHPFFVFGRGWAACNPERADSRYSLKCARLRVGDVCISLTHKDFDVRQPTISSDVTSCLVASPQKAAEATRVKPARRWSAPECSSCDDDVSEQPPSSKRRTFEHDVMHSQQRHSNTVDDLDDDMAAVAQSDEGESS